MEHGGKDRIQIVARVLLTGLCIGRQSASFSRQALLSARICVINALQRYLTQTCGTSLPDQLRWRFCDLGLVLLAGLWQNGFVASPAHLQHACYASVKMARPQSLASSPIQIFISTKLQSNFASQGTTHPLLANLVTSGTAVGLATACTQPMDVLKVRMQLEALVKGHRSVGMVRAVPLPGSCRHHP